jgi:hypothetical protein
MIDRKKLEEEAICLAITQTALQTAQQFAEQQITEAKKQQVYLNTLAVWVVNDYLEMMDIATDLLASDSWNFALRLYSDLADLKLIGLGSLECRPLLSDTCCYIPLDVPSDRLGIIAVKLDLERQEGTLLGFTPTIATGELSLSHLQPFDELLEFLDRQENETKLSQWWQNIFKTDWLPVEEVFTQTTSVLAFRCNQGGVARGKSIDLGRSLALIVKLKSKSSVEIEICLQVYSNDRLIYLPENLRITIFSEEGTSVMEALTKANKTRIKLDFIARLGEHFSLQLEWENARVIEHFVV